MEKSVLEKLYDEYKVDILNDDEYWKLHERVYVIIQEISKELKDGKKYLTRELYEAVADMDSCGNVKNFQKAVRVTMKLINDINCDDI